MAGVEFIKFTPGKTSRVLIKYDTRVSGQHLDAGKVFELPEEEAHLLIVAQKAEAYITPPAQKAK